MAMTRHPFQLDTTQRVVDVGVVLAMELPTIHEAWAVGKGAFFAAFRTPWCKGVFPVNRCGVNGEP
jgi:hypothetical protein